MASQRKTGLQEVAPGIWADVLSIIGPEGGGPNAGFIVAGDKVIVIDSMISLGSAREMLAGIKKALGKGPSFLILTHSHSDHIIGSQVFAPPALVISHENTRSAIIRDGETGIKRTIETRPFLAEDLKGAKVVVPEVTYRDRMSLYFGKRTIELIYLGKAHTLGDTTIYVPDAKVLFAGDLLFNHIIPPIMGDSAGWISAIEQIEKMDIKAIIPGHGFVCGKDEIVELKNFIIYLCKEVKKLYDRKVPKDKALSELNLGIYKGWPHQERLAMDIDLMYREFGGA